MQLIIPRGDSTTILQTAGLAKMDQFHPAGTDHRPIATCRVAHSPRAIHLRYDVKDRYVRCVHQGFQSSVWLDSCVEFFVQPKPDLGYFNFETNCGGSLLLYYIKDPKRTPDGKTIANVQRVTPEQAKGVEVRSSLKPGFESKGDEPIEWWVTVTIPIDFMQEFVGPLVNLDGQTWRGNFYKCGDETPKPHYGSWSPIGEKLEFHQPDKFGKLVFE